MILAAAAWWAVRLALRPLKLMTLAADIQRALNRPAEPARPILPAEAPPGAPIGDVPMDWLASPPW